MDQQTLLLTGEIVALVFFVALGIWRMRQNRQEAKWTAERDTRYDMRRDGQRLTA